MSPSSPKCRHIRCCHGTSLRHSRRVWRPRLACKASSHCHPTARSTQSRLPISTRTLSIQTATGGYQYQDASQLWVPPAGPLTLPDPATAATLAGAYFLANASALPGGHNFDTATPYVEQDKLTTLDSAAAAAGAAPTVETGVDVMVAYGRTLAATATTPSGDTVIVDTSVAGPGSATKMYLGGQSTAPIGLSGGSRDVRRGHSDTQGRGRDMGRPSLTIRACPFWRSRSTTTRSFAIEQHFCLLRTASRRVAEGVDPDMGLQLWTSRREASWWRPMA